MDKEFVTYRENYLLATTNDFESLGLKEFYHRVLKLLKEAFMVSNVLEKTCRIKEEVEQISLLL